LAFESVFIQKKRKKLLQGLGELLQFSKTYLECNENGTWENGLAAIDGMSKIIPSYFRIIKNSLAKFQANSVTRCK
jgi:hypothetical protein